MRRMPLPPHYAQSPFPVRDADLPAKRMRANDLDRSIHGVRVVRGSQPLTLAERCRMLALRLRDDAVFSHTTAALLYGSPLDWRWERSPIIHVTVPAEEASPHATGIRGHHVPMAAADVSLVQGLRITTAARTWCDLAPMLTLGDLVAAGDYLIHLRMPLTTNTELSLRVQSMTGRRGVRIAREAVVLLNDRAESRPESHLRVILVLAGFRPEVNHVLVDTETGREVRPDFLLQDEKVLIEYQGDYHRTKEQWRKDMTRRSRLEAQGWRVIELNADDLKNPEELVARIRDVMARR
jgi:hypothetical protein